MAALFRWTLAYTRLTTPSSSGERWRIVSLDLGSRRMSRPSGSLPRHAGVGQHPVKPAPHYISVRYARDSLLDTGVRQYDDAFLIPGNVGGLCHWTLAFAG
jgi:hypothetical protein